MDLQEARKVIEEIDKNMAALFEKRMNTVTDVAKYKIENGLPVLDAKREERLLEKNEAYIENPEFIPYYKDFLNSLMRVSKNYQNVLMEGLRVAYSGVEGAFANIAAGKIFPNAVLVPYGSFDAAYKAVVNHEAEACVLPIENSYAGEVGQVTDLLFEGDLTVSGIYDLKVNQNLVAIKGSNINNIKKVISHPQALMQCENYIHDHKFVMENEVNTAVAAKKVSELKDLTVAAIASKETADLYDLEVLESNINKSSTNTTKFVVLTNGQGKSGGSDDYSAFILMFTLKNAAGTLSKALNIIGEFGYNIRVIRSRPLRDLNWQYYFYLEVEGKISSKEGRDMLAELNKKCDRLKVLGTYKPDISILN
jgi:chorismate mutase/prephenate dehydratase